MTATELQVDSLALSRPRHGTIGAISRHRHAREPLCAECKTELLRYNKRRESPQMRVTAQIGWVDAAPIRAHIMKLVAAGYSLRSIATVSGSNISSLCYVTQGSRKRVLQRTADRILSTPIPKHPVGTSNLVDPTGARRRVQALMRMGWPKAEIAAHCGLSTSGLRHLLHTNRHVRTATVVALKQAFDELAMRPGPSDQTRRHAERLGWLPPLAWDDDTIDHPLGAPGNGERSYDEVLWERVFTLATVIGGGIGERNTFREGRALTMKLPIEERLGLSEWLIKRGVRRSIAFEVCGLRSNEKKKREGHVN